MTTSTQKEPVAVDLSEWISQAQAARLRKVTRQAIGRLVENGRLRTLEIGGRFLVNRVEVERFVPLPPGRPKKRKS